MRSLIVSLASVQLLTFFGFFAIVDALLVTPLAVPRAYFVQRVAAVSPVNFSTVPITDVPTTAAVPATAAAPDKNLPTLSNNDGFS